MATPMLVPLLLLGGATVAFAAASSKKKYAAPPGTVRTYTLDTSLPASVRDQVLAALATEQDPNKLEAFATAIAPTYPLSAAALRQKASMLRAGTLPKNPVDLLAQVPDPVRTQVMQQLMLQNDPNALEAYAAQLAPQFPAAAAALRMKADVLRGLAPEVAPPTPGASPTSPAISPSANVSAPAPPAVSPSPSPSPAPIPEPPPIAPSTPPPVVSLPAIPEIPIPSFIPPTASPTTPASPAAPTPTASPATFIPGLDANMPPEMQKAVTGALTTESDPAKLEGFASAIQAQYPIASGLLKAKAEALRLMSGIPAVVTPPAPQPVIVPSAPPLAPIATSGTYTVLPGDFPIKIAQKLVGNGNRWKELVAANPQKKTAPDGNFASLLPGEVLKLPASWTTSIPTAPASPVASPAAAIIPNLAPALAALPGALAALPAALSLPPAPPSPLSTAPAAIAASLASGTYKVISGDNPSRIARNFTGNANRWKELVAANPQKKTGPDGNFTSLLPGETLHLPASWIGGANAAHA